jgi:hypothetical protein
VRDLRARDAELGVELLRERGDLHRCERGGFELVRRVARELILLREVERRDVVGFRQVGALRRDGCARGRRLLRSATRQEHRADGGDRKGRANELHGVLQ